MSLESGNLGWWQVLYHDAVAPQILITMGSLSMPVRPLDLWGTLVTPAHASFLILSLDILKGAPVCLPGILSPKGQHCHPDYVLNNCV